MVKAQQASVSYARQSKRVLITEIQTGSASASDEFIELYNPDENPINITGWQLRYLNASATGQSTLIAQIASTDGTPVMLASDQYYVLHTPSVHLPEGVAGQEFSAKLSNAPKVIALYQQQSLSCELIVNDAVAWGAPFGEGLPLGASSQDNSPKLLQRLTGQLEFYSDTTDNSIDFALINAEPDPLSPMLAVNSTIGTHNIGDSVTQDQELYTIPVPSLLPTLPMQNCVPLIVPEAPQFIEPVQTQPTGEYNAIDQLLNVTDIPHVQVVEEIFTPPAVVISELLPDPISPKTDAQDEYFELHNTGNVDIDLSLLAIRIGTETYRQYQFPVGTTLAAGSYGAFFSSQMNFALSNTGNTVSLVTIAQPDVLLATVSYPKAEEGNSWSIVDNIWLWTSQQTPAAPNQKDVNAVNGIATTTASSELVKKPTVIKKTAKTKTAKATVKKSTKTPAASTKAKETTKTISSTTPTSNYAAIDVRRPIHLGVLALVGVFALIYGAYEYRSDVARIFRKLRRNRADS